MDAASHSSSPTHAAQTLNAQLDRKITIVNFDLHRLQDDLNDSLPTPSISPPQGPHHACLVSTSAAKETSHTRLTILSCVCTHAIKHPHARCPAGCFTALSASPTLLFCFPPKRKSAQFGLANKADHMCQSGQ